MQSKFMIEHECIGAWCTEGVCLYMCMYLHVLTVVQYVHMITMVDQSEDNTDGQELASDHLDTSSSISTPASLVSYESLKHILPGSNDNSSLVYGKKSEDGRPFVHWPASPTQTLQMVGMR